MDGFFIDKLGSSNDDEEIKNSVHQENDGFLSSSTLDLSDRLPEEIEFTKKKTPKKKGFSLNDTYLITSYKNVYTDENSSKIDKLLEKSVVHKCLEQLHSVPMEKKKRTLIRERKKLREQTKGKNWFDMPATKLTEEIKTDFELLKMRSVLDSKHVYKKNDITKVPKYFQIGKVIESSADFFNGRIPRAQRKKTIVDELLADAEFKKYQKKKFKEIMDENRRKKRTVKTIGKKKVQKKNKSKK